jgi:preprotein translocase subunit SecE
MNIFQKPISFLKEVRVELGKVSWSTRDELIGSTAVVIVTTAILAVFIGLIDVLLSKALQALFKI